MIHLLSQFAATAPTFANSPKCIQGREFFGLRPWYYYLHADKNCDITNFNVLPGGSEPSDILLVLAVIIDDLLRISALLAIGFIVYGGIQYITSQGSPDQTAKAQSTIQNAIIGLVLSVLAIAIVSFLSNRFS